MIRHVNLCACVCECLLYNLFINSLLHSRCFSFYYSLGFVSSFSAYMFTPSWFLRWKWTHDISVKNISIAYTYFFCKQTHTHTHFSKCFTCDVLVVLISRKSLSTSRQQPAVGCFNGQHNSIKARGTPKEIET